ncbi:hypothetical protein PILCRDRAFT_815113 [Piloderma croceum F 1598]|uniref:Uncharacterized protein n=1 Tax=Piloderma croceum (strain F 1598) TaxID=765440 RepID=A0A0C3CCZ0_PILCF|nr:hypothetical protein PILCRDRAFT_815113 [Piloderma croceum F 1598]
MPLIDKLLCRTNSSAEKPMPADTKEPKKVLQSFIAKNPNALYTFDSERGAPQSEICREEGDKRRECIMLQMYSTKLFKAMQDQGFFCALPMDPARTHMECTRLPKS